MKLQKSRPGSPARLLNGLGSLVVLVLLGIPVPAIPVHIEVVNGGEPVEIEFAQMTPGGGDPVRVVVDPSEPSVVDLQSGSWSAFAGADDRLFFPRLFQVPAEGAVRLTLEGWPVARLTGRLGRTPERELERTGVVRATFEGRGVSSRLPGSEVNCTAGEDRSFSCRVPVGSLKVRIDPGPFAPHFYTLDLSANETVELGELSLHAGESLSGEIVAPGVRIPNYQDVEVLLRSVGSSGHVNTRRARVDGDGRFQLRGLEPGRYALTAALGEREGRVPLVEILEGRHAILKEPVVLQSPTLLRVSVAPFSDPGGGAWRVEALEAEHGRGVVLESWSVDELTGISSPKRVASKDLEFRLLDSRGAVWESRRIDLSGLEEELLSFTPTPRRVSGSVKMAGEPIPALVTIGLGGTSLVAGPDGRFDGEVPPWEPMTPVLIQVQNELLGITREIARELPEGHVADLEIELPGTVVRGSVTDPSGQPAQRTFITATAIEDTPDSARLEMVQTASDDEGEFVFAGLDGVEYELIAGIGGPYRSKPVRVSLVESDLVEDVVLELRRARDLHGRVVVGERPIAGAIITVRSTSTSAPVVRSATSGADGTFSIVAAGDVGELVDVNVATITSGFKMFRTRLPDQLIEIPLDASPGILHIRAPQSSLEHGVYLVFHRGAFVTVDSLGRSEVGMGNGAYRMEPGAYALCRFSAPAILSLPAGAILPNESCVSGYLPPAGVISLEMGAELSEDEG